MNTEAAYANTSRRVAVRWPLRVFAGIVIVAGMVGAGGLALSAWHQGGELARWQLLASLPGLIWFGRACWYAALRGRSPVDESWPFASQRVFTVYVILWSVAMYL